MSIREQTLGREHPKTAVSLRCLASIYQKQHKYEQAEAFLHQSLTICEQTLGPDHPVTTVVLHSLAHLYEDEGKYEQAESTHLQELVIREQTLGPEILERLKASVASPLSTKNSTNMNKPKPSLLGHFQLRKEPLA